MGAIRLNNSGYYETARVAGLLVFQQQHDNKIKFPNHKKFIHVGIKNVPTPRKIWRDCQRTG